MNYNIAIKIIIMNDSRQSMVNVWEKLFFDNNIVATESINPNFKFLSYAYNIRCLSIDQSMNINKIKKILNSNFF
jgi:thiamine pyrophosphate-dependent acetolactate synthase large subunit-like protein